MVYSDTNPDDATDGENTRLVRVFIHLVQKNVQPDFQQSRLKE